MLNPRSIACPYNFLEWLNTSAVDGDFPFEDPHVRMFAADSRNAAGNPRRSELQVFIGNQIALRPQNERCGMWPGIDRKAWPLDIAKE